MGQSSFTFLWTSRWAVAPWAVIGIFMFILYSEIPVRVAEIRSLSKDVGLLETEIQSLNGLDDELVQLKRERARLYERYAKESASFPQGGATSHIYSAIHQLSKDAGVHIVGVGESQASERGQATGAKTVAFGDLHISLTIEGEYKAILRFTNAIETHAYAMRVRSFELTHVVQNLARLPISSPARPLLLSGELRINVAIYKSGMSK